MPPALSLFPSLSSELSSLLHLACPMILVNISSMALQLVSVMFVGHLGELSLSRSTIATSFTNVVGVSVVVGMATALDTLCGQAYGAKKFKLLGLYLQRSLIVLNLCAAPFTIVYVYVGNILQWLKQDPQIAVGAGKYSCCLIPTLFAYATSESYARYLLSQSLAFPILYCGLATIVCHVPLCWVLVYKSGLGYLGAAIAASVSAWLNALLLLIYSRFSNACKRSRTPWSWEAFHDLSHFLSLAIPSTAMVCLEWWCYELLVLLAGLLPNPVLETSTLSICLNTAALHFQIPFGIGSAVSTRVSNELGAGNAKLASNAFKVALWLALSVTSIISVILLSIRNVLGLFYSNDQDVIFYVSKITPMLSLSFLFDSTQVCLSGVARACGLQKYGAFINLGSYYLVGLPIACTVAFMTSLRGQGLWLAAVCAPFTQIIWLSILVGSINWEKQANEVLARLQDASTESLLPHETLS